MQNTDRIWSLVDAKREPFQGLSDRVWGMPEIAYTEHCSVAEHIAMLEEEGFRITRDLAGIPTAVMGEAGDGGPVIAILGEYDALPGLSQVAGIAEPKELEKGGHGHGCGHNLLGSAALLAATAVKDLLAEQGIKARVRYYGCPAEEGGAAKAFMARAGLFDDVDVAISWHPASFNRVDEANSLANMRIDFTFRGRASHASASPHLGRSALDACELMSVGVQYLREHIPSDCRIHHAILETGGVAPNVVQALAKVRYAVRARDLVALNELVPRVKAVAEGAAIMTGTKVEMQVVSAVSNLLDNTPLAEAMQRVFDRLDGPGFDAQDMAFAGKIQETLGSDDVATAYRRVGVEPRAEPLCNFVVPIDSKGDPMVGSTDVGDVSWAVPTIQARIATHAIGTPGHTWQITAQGKMPAAHKGMVYAAKVMAGTAMEVIRSPELIAAARADYEKRTGGKGYQCPLPPDVMPPIKTMSGS
ncbi:MAG: amidohydrolase [Hyphomicrobiaceae bacterium]